MRLQYNTIFTIGHSNHSLDAFIELLIQHHITVLADVRSVPYSQFTPHFNREPLVAALKMRQIRYVYLGRELGGRSDDPDYYEEDGRISYQRLAQTDHFREGIERVMRGAVEHRIVLMCSEKEPVDCHRTLLVARSIDEQGMDITHIHADGRLESHADATQRLVNKSSSVQEQQDMFGQQLVKEAIAHQARRVAHTLDNSTPYRGNEIG